MNVRIPLVNEAVTTEIAAKLAKIIMPPSVITLSGVIGAGKTTFVRAYLRALGITGAIKSPTFSLVETYEAKSIQYHHFDLYRIVEATELEYIGFRDYFSDASILLIEWPQSLPIILEKTDLELHFEWKNNARELNLLVKSSQGSRFLEGLI